MGKQSAHVTSGYTVTSGRVAAHLGAYGGPHGRVAALMGRYSCDLQFCDETLHCVYIYIHNPHMTERDCSEDRLDIQLKKWSSIRLCREAQTWTGIHINIIYIFVRLCYRKDDITPHFHDTSFSCCEVIRCHSASLRERETSWKFRPIEKQHTTRLSCTENLKKHLFSRGKFMVLLCL